MMSHGTRERERGVVEAGRRQRALGSIIPIQAKLKQGSRWIDSGPFLAPFLARFINKNGIGFAVVGFLMEGINSSVNLVLGPDMATLQPVFIGPEIYNTSLEIPKRRKQNNGNNRKEAKSRTKYK